MDGGKGALVLLDLMFGVDQDLHYILFPCLISSKMLDESQTL